MQSTPVKAEKYLLNQLTHENEKLKTDNKNLKAQLEELKIVINEKNIHCDKLKTELSTRSPRKSRIMEKAENSILANKEDEIKRLKILLEKKNEKIHKLSSPVKRNNNGNFSVSIGAVRKLDFTMKGCRNKTPVTTDLLPSDTSKSVFNPKVIRLDNRFC